MSEELAVWCTLFLLGAYHGINPGMGWLFAVARGMQEHRARAVAMSLPPIALAVRGKNKVFSGGAKEVGLLKCGDKIAYFASQSGMESSPASPNRPEPRKFAPQKLKNLQTEPL